MSKIFAVQFLLLVSPISAQSRTICVANNVAASGLVVRTTTTICAIAQYRFDIAPCVEEGRDRPVTGSKSSVEATRQAPPLIDWIMTQTHWTIQETPPIRLAPPAEMNKIFTGGEPIDLNIEAIYSDRDHIVYLSDRWRPNDLRDRSALLHELVHHLQYLNGVKATCPQEYEWQAYHLQVDWLREQGVEDPLKLMGISNPLFIYELGRCPEF